MTNTTDNQPDRLFIDPDPLARRGVCAVRSSAGEVEYVRADIAEGLAEALHNMLEPSAHLSPRANSQATASLARYKRPLG